MPDGVAMLQRKWAISRESRAESEGVTMAKNRTMAVKNAKAKKKIDQMDSTKKIYNFGYVSNVDVMMDAADVIITKPGGLTTSESIAKRFMASICFSASAGVFSIFCTSTETCRQLLVPLATPF